MFTLKGIFCTFDFIAFLHDRGLQEKIHSYFLTLFGQWYPVPHGEIVSKELFVYKNTHLDVYSFNLI